MEAQTIDVFGKKIKIYPNNWVSYLEKVDDTHVNLIIRRQDGDMACFKIDTTEYGTTAEKFIDNFMIKSCKISRGIEL